jgi:hypothetical protein
MENRIEQEINRTLEYMSDSIDIQVSPLFAENLSSRIANMRVSSSLGYRNRALYPVAILLMVVLNFAALTASFTGQSQVNGGTDYQATLLASEYGIGQDNYMIFFE